MVGAINAFYINIEEIGGRGADEVGDEKAVAFVVDILRRANLDDLAIFHHHNTISHAHRLGLIVSHEDRSRARLRMDGLQLCAR